VTVQRVQPEPVIFPVRKATVAAALQHIRSSCPAPCRGSGADYTHGLFMNATDHVLAGAVLALAFCASSNASEPLYDGLGSYSRKITTKNAKAQRYFDQGLALLHGFNHSGAIRSFQKAARLDPQCAMAHWGIALAAGPHINYPLVPPPMAELAWKELTLAQQHASNASEVDEC